MSRGVWQVEGWEHEVLQKTYDLIQQVVQLDNVVTIRRIGKLFVNILYKP